MKGKSIRFSITSLTGTLILSVAALPGSSLIGLLPGMVGALLPWLAVHEIARRSKRITDKCGIAHGVDLARCLPYNGANLVALQSHTRNFANQANLLALNNAIDVATEKGQERDVTQIPTRKRKVVPIRHDDTDLTCLAEQQRRLINQFKV